jgi:hypothetical protein
MAVRYVTTSCSDSTSAEKCKLVGYFVGTFNTSNSYYDDLSTKRYGAAHAVLAGSKVQNLIFFARINSLASGVLTFQLQEYVGAAWKDVTVTNGYSGNAMATVNVPGLPPNVGAYLLEITPAFEFTSAGNQLRWTVSCNVSSRVYWWRDATAGNYSFGTVTDGDDASGIADGDVIVVAPGLSFMPDATRTLGAFSRSMYFCQGATLDLNTPAASTLTLAGPIFMSHDVTVRGGEVIPHPASAQLTIVNTGPIASAVFETGGVYYGSGSPAASVLHALTLHGEKPTCHGLKAEATPALTNVINLKADLPASHVDYDEYRLLGKIKIGADSRISYGVKTGARQLTLYASSAPVSGFTISLANPATVALNGHGALTGDSVVFSTTGNLPAHIVAGQTYYIRIVNTNSFYLYDTQENALIGSAAGRVSTAGDAQSGAHSMRIGRMLDYPLIDDTVVVNFSETPSGARTPPWPMLAPAPRWPTTPCSR